MKLHPLVSIPIGFSRALQHKSYADLKAEKDGFNPYRVFSGSATLKGEDTRDLEWSFNPYRVFSGSATSVVALTGELSVEFQSLSGFLGLCNLNVDGILSMCKLCFNPYRVFSGSAT